MSGFQDAGITRGIMIVLGLTSLTVALTDMKPYTHLQLVPHMTTYHQFWRILIHPLAFANSTELLVAEVLLYHVGVHIERSFGPRKYSSFVLVSSIVSTLLALASIIVLNPFGINSIPAGPYGIIFSLIWQYKRTVPALYSFRLLGIDTTNKSFMYILAILLALTSPPASIAAALIGLGAGYLYRTDTLIPLPSFSRRRGFKPLKSYRIPLSLHVLLARLFAPLSGPVTPPRRSQRVLPGQVDRRSTAPAPDQATLRTLLANMASAQRRQPAAAAVSGVSPTTPATIVPVPASSAPPTATPVQAGGARQAMGEWVSEMTGRGTGARAPTEEEISTLMGMFPNMGRETVVRALQRSNNNTAQAVESLLQEGS